MSGASPFLGDVMALLVNGRLVILASGIKGDASSLVERINSGSMDAGEMAYTARLIGPGEPLPEWETASEDERREAVERMCEEIERVERWPFAEPEPTWTSEAASMHEHLMRAFDDMDFAKHFRMTADEDGVHMVPLPERPPPLPPSGGGWNPARADRLRRKNKRRRRR